MHLIVKADELLVPMDGNNSNLSSESEGSSGTSSGRTQSTAGAARAGLSDTNGTPGNRARPLVVTAPVTRKRKHKDEDGESLKDRQLRRANETLMTQVLVGMFARVNGSLPQTNAVQEQHETDGERKD